MLRPREWVTHGAYPLVTIVFPRTSTSIPLRAKVARASRRAIRHPKVFLNDTGLIAALQGLDERRCREDPVLLGPLVENFAGMELRKQLGWSRQPGQLFHFRTRTGHEVDIVLERPDGGIVGIEVKLTHSPGPRDFAGLRALAEGAGRRFRRGILLYAGPHVFPFGDRLAAVPLPCLWQWGQ